MLLAVATAVKVAGTAFSALQAAASSRYEARVADRNAVLETEAARNAADVGRQEAIRQYRKIGQISGQQQTAIAANGIDTSFGSAVQVQEDTAAIGAEDVKSIYDQTYQNVRGFDINAANYKARARGARQAATGALIKGVFDVASTALDGATQYTKLPGKGFG